MNYRILVLVLCGSIQAHAQRDSDYQELKTNLVAKYQNKSAGKFSSFVKGVNTHLVTSQKVIAFTFDACGGRGNGYDADLIEFLRKEKISATLFLSGLWIDEHPELSLRLARDTLFEIENHGLRHRPCSVNGASRYGIRGTGNVGEVVDEIELNSTKIQNLVGRRPIFYRPGTATCDEACGEIAADLGELILHFDVLSGDAVAGTAASVIEANIIRKVHPGAVVIMHMNHPEWGGLEALKRVIPKLRKEGYSFVTVKDYSVAEDIK